jgi:ParB/RepB/Spo0J family partition protein
VASRVFCPPSAAQIDIAAITIGNRHRRDMGDIQGLAASIKDIGLLQPICVRTDGTLIAGARRIAVFKLLGWTEIPAHIVDIDAVVRGEFLENICRKNFTPSELVAISKVVEERERELARERMTLGKVSTGSAGKTRDKLAAPFDISGRTLEKMQDVVAAGEAEPEKYGHLVEDMDRSGKVNGPYRRLKNMQAAEAIRAAPPPLPGKAPYSAGMVDIPWAFEPDDENAPHRGVLPYPTLSIEQAMDLDVASILHHDCVVGMWVTNFVLVNGFYRPVLRSWRLGPKTVITWPKERVGRGHWAKGQTEHLVIATRGKPLVTLTDQTTLLKGPFQLVQKNAHSAKPVEAYSYFESLYPAPRYFDLFSRYQHNDKWDCHGDQVPLGAAVLREAAE